MVKVGAPTTGGNSPSKRCPPIGSSPETIGRESVGFRLECMGDAADDDLGGAGEHGPGLADPLPQPLDEKPAIGIEHDLDDLRVLEGRAELRPEGFFELADEIEGWERGWTMSNPPPQAATAARAPNSEV